MNSDNCELATGLVSRSYIRQGQEALARRQRLVKALLSSRRLPERGWDEATIEMLVRDCSAMDSNNFLDNVGLGEREGRVACPLVARRHYGLAHGIGRSGDVAAEQPKAAGSSLLASLTALLAADALKIAGLTGLGPVSVLPLATGMAMTLVLLALRPRRPPGADVVVWSRVDQKTCLKAVTAAGLVPHVVQLRAQGDELVTDVQAIDDALSTLGPNRILAVVTTTSCFAPRAPDDVVAVARLCAAAGVAHVVNNAYGIQSRQTCRTLSEAWTKGRVDAVVQSTDKNFMVPVGGALVAAPAARPELVPAVNGSYPGRAAVAAHLDLLMTLLHWGAEGWRQVLDQREKLVPYLRTRLQDLATRQGERLLETPGNPISMAVTLESLVAASAAARAAVQASKEAGAEPGPRAAPGATGATAGPEAVAAADVRAAGPKTGEGVDPGLSAGAAEAEASWDDGMSDVKDRAMGEKEPAESTGPEAAVGLAVSVSMPAQVAAQATPLESGQPPHKRKELQEEETCSGAQEGERAAQQQTQPPGKQEPDQEVDSRPGMTPADVAGARQRRPAPDVTFFGSMLWSRCVSGTRVVAPGKTQTVAGISFQNYGSHTEVPYPSSYMTAAAALGTTHSDVDTLIERLEQCFNEFRKKCGGGKATAPGGLH